MRQIKRRGRYTRRKTPIAFVAAIFLSVTTVVLCGISYPRSDVEAGVPNVGAIESETTMEPAPEPENKPEESPEKFRYYDNIKLEYELQELVWAACEETGCPYELALAVIYRESSYRNITGDNGNSIGYMQVQPKWHKPRMDKLGVTDLYDPYSNFRVGCDLLADLIEKYDSVEAALTCYNTGKPGKSRYADRVLSYMNETFFPETDTTEDNKKKPANNFTTEIN